MKLSFRIKIPPKLAFEYLTDMQKFASVHPVISKIERTGEKEFLVYETLRIGFIPFSFTYPVTIEQNASASTVIIRAVIFRLTRIDMEFVLRADGDHTIIDEEITFKSPLPVSRVMRRIFSQQHARLIKNIEKRTGSLQDQVPAMGANDKA